jgi:hypothetical protein
MLCRSFDPEMYDKDFQLQAAEISIRCGAIVGYWRGYFDQLDLLTHAVTDIAVCDDGSKFFNEGAPILLPFDTVILPLSGRLKRFVAEQRSEIVAPTVTHDFLYSAIPRSSYDLLPLTDYSWPLTVQTRIRSRDGKFKTELITSRFEGELQPRIIRPRSTASLEPPNSRWHFMWLPPAQRILSSLQRKVVQLQVKHEPASEGLREVGFEHDAAVPGRLSVGYYTSDFRDHPTSHMIEGLFRLHDRSRVAVLALNYGKYEPSDNSDRMRLLADAFVDMYHLNLEDTARTIAATGVHILLDLQPHLQGPYSYCLPHSTDVNVPVKNMSAIEWTRKSCQSVGPNPVLLSYQATGSNR